MTMGRVLGTAPAPPRHAVNPWLVLVLVCLGQFMVVLDATNVSPDQPVGPVG